MEPFVGHWMAVIGSIIVCLLCYTSLRGKWSDAVSRSESLPFNIDAVTKVFIIAAGCCGVAAFIEAYNWMFVYDKEKVSDAALNNWHPVTLILAGGGALVSLVAFVIWSPAAPVKEKKEEKKK